MNKQYARDLELDEPNIVQVIFKDGDQGDSYIEYRIVVYKEDAEYFESKLLDEGESIFYAQKETVYPIRRLVP